MESLKMDMDKKFLEHSGEVMFKENQFIDYD